MSNCSAATDHAKSYNSNFVEESSSPLQNDAMIDSNSTVSSYGYSNTIKGQKHLMNDLHRRTSQRKRAKVGPAQRQQHENRSFRTWGCQVYMLIFDSEGYIPPEQIYIFSGNLVTGFQTKNESKNTVQIISFSAIFTILRNNF